LKARDLKEGEKIMTTLALPGAVLGGAGVIAGIVWVHRSRNAGSLHLGLDPHLPGKRKGDGD
jgi:hypothetical protein